MAKRQYLQFTKVDIQMVSTSLLIKEMKIHTPSEILLYTPNWLQLERWTITSVDEDVEKLEPSHFDGRNGNGFSPFQDYLAISTKVNTSTL